MTNTKKPPMLNKEIKKRKTKGIILPLTYGYGLKLQLVKIRRVFFQTRWKYVSVVLSMIVIVSTGLIIKNNFTAFGATYGWVQTSWLGGASTGIAEHTAAGAVEDWDKYTSKDSRTVINGEGEVTMTTVSGGMGDDSDANFDQATGLSGCLQVNSGSVSIKSGIIGNALGRCYFDLTISNSWLIGASACNSTHHSWCVAGGYDGYAACAVTTCQSMPAGCRFNVWCGYDW